MELQLHLSCFDTDWLNGTRGSDCLPMMHCVLALMLKIGKRFANDDHSAGARYGQQLLAVWRSAEPSF